MYSAIVPLKYKGKKISGIDADHKRNSETMKKKILFLSTHFISKIYKKQYAFFIVSQCDF